ncbi:hypothetical protein ACWEN3_34090, partial [Streptomyces sp. NPDC004561]
VPPAGRSEPSARLAAPQRGHRAPRRLDGPRVELTAGPGPEGGFRVVARLPLGASAASAVEVR